MLHPDGHCPAVRLHAGLHVRHGVLVMTNWKIVIFRDIVCPSSLDPFYIVTYYIKRHLGIVSTNQCYVLRCVITVYNDI